MKNDAKLYYQKDNLNFQDAPKEFDSQKLNNDDNSDLFMINRGFPHYDKKYKLESEDAMINYDDEQKKTEQNGFVDDTDFGQKTIKPNSNDPEPDKSWSNYDDDRKNSEQEDYGENTDEDVDKLSNNSEGNIKNQNGDVDDSDFGTKNSDPIPNRNDNDV